MAFDATPILNQLYAINGNDSSASLQVERLIADVLQSHLRTRFGSYELDGVAGIIRSIAPCAINFRHLAGLIESAIEAHEHAGEAA